MIRNLLPHPLVIRIAAQACARLAGEIRRFPAPAGGRTTPEKDAAILAVLDRVVAPGTGPRDGAVRDATGQIAAVTRLVRVLGA